MSPQPGPLLDFCTQREQEGRVLIRRAVNERLILTEKAERQRGQERGVSPMQTTDSRPRPLLALLNSSTIICREVSHARHIPRAGV